MRPRHSIRESLELSAVHLVCSCVAAFILSGCGNPSASDVDVSLARNPVLLKVLVIDDPAVGEAAKRRWEAEELGELSVTHQTMEEFEASDFAIPAEYDVLIYPERFQADLLHRNALLEITHDIWNSEQVNKNDLLPPYRGALLRQGDRYYALPLSGVPLMLIYRADCLEALGVAPPSTWEEFEELASRLGAAEGLKDAAGQPLPTALALPLADDWAAHLLLARAAASVRSVGKLSTVFQIEQMEPLLATPPFQLALESLNRLRPFQYRQGDALTPGDVFRALVEGQVALGITWPTSDVAVEAGPAAKQLRLVRLPGSPRWYDQSRSAWIARGPGESWQVDYLGSDVRVVSVLKNSLHAHQALQFVAWLSSKQISQRIAPTSRANGPCRASQLGDPLRWVNDVLEPEVAGEYAQQLLAIYQSKLILTFPRIIKQRRYLHELAKAVRTCLDQEQPADQALQEAASVWRRLNDQIGASTQRDFLRRGEGF